MIFPLSYIPFMNIGIIIIFILFIYSGYKKGFLLKVLGCLSFIVVGFLAWYIAPVVGKFIHLFPSDLTPLKDTIAEIYFYDVMNRMLLFVVIFIIFIISTILLRPLFKTIGAIPILAQVNRLFGIVFGFLQAFILIFVLTIVLQTPLFANGAHIIDQSYLSSIGEVSDKILFFANDTFSKYRSIQKIVTPSSKLDDQDFIEIENWLSDQGIEDAKIQEFMMSLRES